MPTDSPKPTFDSACERILGGSLEIAKQRGGQYGDTWRIGNVVDTLTRATLQRFGVEFDPEQMRLLLLAALADVKDSRALNGSWNLDSIVDGVNYRAVYAALRDDYENEQRAMMDRA